ncbi:MAG: site-2 protease family protein [Bacillota bacterium]
MDNIMQLILLLPVLLLSLSIHELSHGYASYKMGDPTAKNAGRLTLNPLAHLDPVGALVLIMTQRFGWAKPVPINPRYYDNPRRDMMLVSFAGPASNLTLAAFFAIIINMMPLITGQPLMGLLYGTRGNIMITVVNFLYLAIMINISLAIFNLLPFPPLDGSKILRGVLPAKYDRYFNKLEGPIGMLVILVLAYSGILWSIIGPVVNGILNLLVIF